MSDKNPHNPAADRCPCEGCSAGRAAQRKERAEQAAQIGAVLEAEQTGRPATWERSIRIGTDQDGDAIRQKVRMREDARQRMTAAELLADCRKAAHLAAAQLRGRHGIPELTPAEVADLGSDLVCRVLEDANPVEDRQRADRAILPERSKITTAYLVKRAAGIVLNDPDRANLAATADEGGHDLAALAAGAEEKAEKRSKHAAADPMLNPGIDGTPATLEAAADLIGLPPSGRRCAAWLLQGGTIREDWARTWGTTPGYAATRLIPKGRDLLKRHGWDLAAALIVADVDDRDELDDLEAERAARVREAADKAIRNRAILTPRERTDLDPDQHAPVRTRTDRRIIRKSDRARDRAALEAGWTAPRG
jgi:2-hydroxychromene-2-carboxylate isomerase